MPPLPPGIGRGPDGMTIFEYVMILFSLVISLGLAKLLETHAQLLKRGKAVKWSLTYLGWLVMLFLTLIDIWASLWQAHANARWSAGEIGLSLLATILLFYAAIFAAPEVQDEPLDLWTFHMANRHRYIGAMVGYTLIGAWLNATLMQQAFSMANLTSAGPGIALMLAAIFIRNTWAQRILVIATLAVIGFYFAQYLPAIGG